jgi:hypothetical protein
MWSQKTKLMKQVTGQCVSYLIVVPCDVGHPDCKVTLCSQTMQFTDKLHEQLDVGSRDDNSDHTATTAALPQ